MAELLNLQDITKRYGRASALSGLSFTLRSGELLALVGPSGCGKTTALHIIAGLLEPDGGQIAFAGRDWRRESPAARNVALVFQDGALYPHLTVAKNLGFPLHARRQATTEAVARIARRLEIEPLLDRYPHELSGGERQRVALGRALIRRPNLLLLDEPLSSLDPLLREKLRGLIRDLVDETGVATVFVTHDQAEAMAMGDRLAVMRDGRVIQSGTPREIYERPAHEFVARFFGAPAMNLLAGELRQGVVRGPWGEVPSNHPLDRPSVLCGFRPEAVVPVEGESRLRGTLARVEYQGPVKIATVRLPEAEIRLRLHRDKDLPAAGEPVRLGLAPAEVHLFDAATGERLA